jgi:DNA-binding protein Fis
MNETREQVFSQVRTQVINRVWVHNIGLEHLYRLQIEGHIRCDVYDKISAQVRRPIITHTITHVLEQLR